MGITSMTETRDILRLQTWLSPAFPTGAFAYSHGLEALTRTDTIRSPADLMAWIEDLLRNGSGWNDAVLLAEAHQRVKTDREGLSDLADLANALSPSAGRLLETVAQGTAFLRAAEPWISDPGLGLPKDTPLPIAVGALAGHLNIDLEPAIGCYLNAFAGNQVQAALRLFKLGQADGVFILAGLEPTILEIASAAATSSIADLGGCALMADIAAQNQETLETRIFRS